MRGRSEGPQKKHSLTALCVVGLVAIFLVFLYVYFGSRSRGESALEYCRSLRKLGSSYLVGDDDTDKQDESLSKFGFEDREDGIVPKSFPVCDDRHSELITCLDRNLIYQMRLKLDLSLMEHYERHCPLAGRRYIYLIPPPRGYKIPIKWPKNRDEVWQANIPHTHLAHEKSDQNWMVVKDDKIVFPGGGTHFHYGADCITCSDDHKSRGSVLSPCPAQLTAPPPPALPILATQTECLKGSRNFGGRGLRVTGIS